MAYKSCTSCHGQGRVYFGEYKPCTTCAGTGTMWVADSVSTGTRGSGRRYSNKPSGPKASFEENITVLLTLGVFGYVSYIGITDYDLAWYLAGGIGLILAIIVYRLFSGPLSILLTGVKFIIGISILILIVYVAVKYVLPEFFL